MKKPNQTERDDSFWLNAKSPCCSDKMEHEMTTMFSKPYQRWVCVKCGNGWNNTITDTWNYQQGSTVKTVRTPRERINFHDLGDVAKKLPRGGKN